MLAIERTPDDCVEFADYSCSAGLEWPMMDL
jgi:hypothetical protein